MDELTQELDYNRLAREWFKRSLRHLAHCKHEYCQMYSAFYDWLAFDQGLDDSVIAYLLAGFPATGKITLKLRQEKTE